MQPRESFDGLMGGSDAVRVPQQKAALLLTDLRLVQRGLVASRFVAGTGVAHTLRRQCALPHPLLQLAFRHKPVILVRPDRATTLLPKLIRTSRSEEHTSELQPRGLISH